MAKEVVLLSGAKLEISLAPIDDAIDLMDAFTAECKAIHIAADMSDANFYKDVFCTVIPSKPLKAALWKTMERALYKGVRITKDTFENEEARADYLQIMFEVFKENMRPFAKNLYAQFGPLLQGILNFPA